MGQINITLDLEGISGLDYPMVTVDINGQRMFDDRVIGQQRMSFNVTALPKNQITIGHYAKNNDTIIDSTGSIVQDRHCILHFLKIDQIKIDLNFLSCYNFYYLTDDNEQIITNYFGKNGSLTVDFEYPLWKFWYSLQSK